MEHNRLNYQFVVACVFNFNYYNDTSLSSISFNAECLMSITFIYIDLISTEKNVTARSYRTPLTKTKTLYTISKLKLIIYILSLQMERIKHDLSFLKIPF